ncbi:MAG: putative Ig domain-containing protein, partial [Candidatus Thermoplasmatota archaeon]
SWTPTNNDVGVRAAHIVVIVRVTDTSGGFVESAFPITVINVNDAPMITTTSLPNATEGSMYMAMVQAEDPDIGDVLTYSLLEAPEGMSINAQTGRITWMPKKTQAYQTYQVVVMVSDGKATTTQTFSVYVHDPPPTPYHPWLDDYIWAGIVLFLLTMIILLTIPLRRREKD